MDDIDGTLVMRKGNGLAEMRLRQAKGCHSRPQNAKAAVIKSHHLEYPWQQQAAAHMASVYTREIDGDKMVK